MTDTPKPVIITVEVEPPSEVTLRERPAYRVVEDGRCVSRHTTRSGAEREARTLRKIWRARGWEVA
jgi:hypothetical protein